MRLAWPLIGRSNEMEAIEAALSASDVSGIAVCGAAGVGKSRVAREALSFATARGSEARWAIGTSAARPIPLGAFTAWAESGLSDTVQMLREVIDSLTAGRPGAPVVVGIDDVHLLDDLSLFVVQQIVQRGAAKVLLTVLDDEPVPAAVRELWKLGRFARLDVQPLSLDDTTTLLSAVLKGVMDPDACHRLWELTRGNVLYLRNIVEQEVADGRMVQQHHYWQWVGDPVIPPGLVELVEARIGALPTPVCDVVDALAVGEPIELSALRRITTPAAVEEADTRGLITLDRVVDEVEVRVAHPLYGEIRRRRAPATRLRRLRGLVATELATSDHCDDIRVVVRRATLAIESDLTADTNLLVKAARGAVWLADLPLAERLAEAAIRAGAGPEPSFVRAHALSWLSRGSEAEAVLSAIRTSELTDVDCARLAFLQASNSLWALGDPGRAKAVIDDASRTTSSQARRYVDAFLTVYWFAMDQPSDAVEASDRLVTDELPGVVGAEIAWVRTAIFAEAGRTTDAVAAARTGYTAVARFFDAPQLRFNIADAHLSALLLAGRVREALEVADRVRRQAASLPGSAHLLGAAVAGRAALGAGDLASACLLLEQAASGLSAAGHTIGWGYRYLIPRITALAMRGSTGEAAAALAALDKLPRRFRSLGHERSLARAWVTAGQGGVSEAIAVLLSAAETASAKGLFAAEVDCLQTAVQFGDLSSASRLRTLEAIVEGPRVGVAARFAEAQCGHDGAELSALSEVYQGMGELVVAMDAAAHAAVAYRHRGLRGSALAASARATALAEQCGGADTPALRRASEPLPLTRREREVVTLLGTGLSNRAVAERLGLSVRTVESHIYQAMLKTGATSRDELAALLVPRRPTSE